MGKKRRPRFGSMGVWPRKRAKREYPRVRNWPVKKEAIPLGFAGYKAGMTHIAVIDNRKTSITKGEEIIMPVTVVECPPIKIFSIRFYKKNVNSLRCVKEVVNPKLDKEISRKIRKPKKIHSLDGINPKDYDDIRLNVYTQPKLTGIGKKKPEIFEIALGGNIEEKFKFASEHLSKDILLTEVFKEGQCADIKAVTKGHGFQGAVKRFGIGLKPHKSEKGRRAPATHGQWQGHLHFMHRVPAAGQMGYHTRTDYNKKIMMISTDVSKINPKGGFLRYGFVKNPYLLFRGTIPGPSKRIVRFNHPIRPNKKLEYEVPSITFIDLASKQGR